MTGPARHRVPPWPDAAFSLQTYLRNENRSTARVAQYRSARLRWAPSAVAVPVVASPLDGVADLVADHFPPRGPIRVPCRLTISSTSGSSVATTGASTTTGSRGTTPTTGRSAADSIAIRSASSAALTTTRPGTVASIRRASCAVRRPSTIAVSAGAANAPDVGRIDSPPALRRVRRPRRTRQPARRPFPGGRRARPRPRCR